MASRKAWLKQVAASPEVHAWAAASDPAVFAGTSRVQTLNTTYLFRNACCFAVTHADPQRRASLEFMGMRIAGWLIHDLGGPRLSHTWRPQAMAVLWRPRKGKPSDLGDGVVALTSPTTRFTQYANSAPLDVAAQDGPHRATERVLFERTLNQTFTRCNLPRPTSEIREIRRPEPAAPAPEAVDHRVSPTLPSLGTP